MFGTWLPDGRRFLGTTAERLTGGTAGWQEAGGLRVVVDGQWEEPLVIAATFGGRMRGLLGTRAGEGIGVLLLAPCSSVHTFGMSYPIDVAFVSGCGTVLKTIRGLGSGKVVGAYGSCCVFEREVSDNPWFYEGQRIRLLPMQGRDARR